jgi:hypothetical protein
MSVVCRLYLAACRKWRRSRRTLSASAHLRARDGKTFWRNRIDGFCLLFLGQHQHCQASFQRGKSRLTKKL